MQLTKKVRIFPTAEQEEILWHLSEQCRLIYNFALAERRKEWELNNLRDDFDVFPWGKPYYSVGYTKQQNDLPRIKEKYPRYGCIHSKVLQMVLRTLNADYSSFFALRKNGDTNAMPPSFKGKKYFTTMIHNQRGFRIKDGKVTLTQFYKDIPLTFTISEEFGRVYQVSVFKDRDKYYLSIVHEVPEKPYEDNGIYQAIDLGITKTVTAVNTKGKFLEVKNPRPDKYWNPIIDSLQRRGFGGITVYVNKADLDHLITRTKEENYEFLAAAGIPEPKRTIITEYIEDLKDEKLGMYPMVRATTRISEDAGEFERGGW